MKALLETVERLEAWLSETKISGTIPPAFVEKCTAILNAAPSPGGLWDAWKIAAKDMARAIQMDGGTSDALRTVGFAGWVVGVVDEPTRSAHESAAATAAYFREFLGLEF